MNVDHPLSLMHFLDHHGVSWDSYAIHMMLGISVVAHISL